MLRKWESDTGLGEGWMWDAWVQSISELMKHHGLQDAVRKDKTKRNPNEPESAFVRLICKLQEHLPEEMRRHAHMRDPDALAQAIYRARKFDRWLELFPPNIREKVRRRTESREEREKRYKEFEERLLSDPNWIKRGPGSYRRAEIAAIYDAAEAKDKSKPEDR
jgi:hypothetical protein